MPTPQRGAPEREPLQVRLLGPFSVRRRERPLTGRDSEIAKGAPF